MVVANLMWEMFTKANSWAQTLRTCFSCVVCKCWWLPPGKGRDEENWWTRNWSLIERSKHIEADMPTTVRQLQSWEPITQQFCESCSVQADHGPLLVEAWWHLSWQSQQNLQLLCSGFWNYSNLSLVMRHSSPLLWKIMPADSRLWHAAANNLVAQYSWSWGFVNGSQWVCSRQTTTNSVVVGTQYLFSNKVLFRWFEAVVALF